ncbi:MAG: hypothetical protein IKP95_10620 [Ruminococcus sp.]|nr:hypothetical protein [Ruminococcus sp.]
MSTNPETSVRGKVRDGLVWYCAFVPAVALLLERFALNKYLGFLIWGIVITARPLCCYIDRRNLLSAGYEQIGSPWFVLLPTVYLFKRCMIFRQNTALAVVCLICFSYGAIGNGFISGLFVDNDTVLQAVKNEAMTSISEFKSFAAYESFEKAVGRALKDVDYELSVNGDERIITVKGTDLSGTDQYVFVFRVVHDGYTYTDFGLKSVTKNGDVLTGKDRTEALKELFKTEDSSSDSSVI